MRHGAADGARTAPASSSKRRGVRCVARAGRRARTGARPKRSPRSGELTLARGEARAARDLIERALLLAPDYRFAVELRARLHGR